MLYWHFRQWQGTKRITTRTRRSRSNGKWNYSNGVILRNMPRSLRLCNLRSLRDVTVKNWGLKLLVRIWPLQSCSWRHTVHQVYIQPACELFFFFKGSWRALLAGSGCACLKLELNSAGRWKQCWRPLT